MCCSMENGKYIKASSDQQGSELTYETQVLILFLFSFWFFIILLGVCQ